MDTQTCRCVCASVVTEPVHVCGVAANGRRTFCMTGLKLCTPVIGCRAAYIITINDIRFDWIYCIIEKILWGSLCVNPVFYFYVFPNPVTFCVNRFGSIDVQDFSCSVIRTPDIMVLFGFVYNCN